MNNELSGVVPTFRYCVEVDTMGIKDLINPIENPSRAMPEGKAKAIDSDFAIAVASGYPVGLLISVIISRR